MRKERKSLYHVYCRGLRRDRDTVWPMTNMHGSITVLNNQEQL